MSAFTGYWAKLRNREFWDRALRERLNEPLHMIFMSFLVMLVGSLRTKIAFDLVTRRQHAYGLLAAADEARRLGIKEILAVEFGVASGAGLRNLASLAVAIEKETGVRISVAGFDTGQGMPPPRDYRDHPELYQTGDFPMLDMPALKDALPKNCTLIIGDLDTEIPAYLASRNAPVGFVSIDVDYYWSALEALKILEEGAEKYLPIVHVYFDDAGGTTHNKWCGELAAIEDFNAAHGNRKIGPINNLASTRIFKHSMWLTMMYHAHVLDHPTRSVDAPRPGLRILDADGRFRLQEEKVQQ